MKYYTKGWNKFKIIITPEEMENIFEGFHQVVFDRRVPAEFTEALPENFYKKYGELYKKLAEGYVFEWNRDYKYFDVNMGFSDDLELCTYQAAFKDEKDGKYYKTDDFEEPCVGIHPFVMMLDTDLKLNTKYSYLQFPMYTVGMEIYYPKEIYFFRENKKTSVYVSSKETKGYNVYETIKSRVKKISVKLKFNIGEKSYKPDIWIGKTAQKDFQNFYFSKKYDIEMKN